MLNKFHITTKHNQKYPLKELIFFRKPPRQNFKRKTLRPVIKICSSDCYWKKKLETLRKENSFEVELCQVKNKLCILGV